MVIFHNMVIYLIMSGFHLYDKSYFDPSILPDTISTIISHTLPRVPTTQMLNPVTEAASSKSNLNKQNRRMFGSLLNWSDSMFLESHYLTVIRLSRK